MKTVKVSELVLAVIVIMGLLTLWVSSGDKFIFKVPQSIKTESPFSQSREVTFFNHIPVFGWYSPKEVPSTFYVGETIGVDLLSSDVSELYSNINGKSFRLDVKVDEQVSHSYFFTTDTDLKNAKYVSLRITGIYRPAEALHQNDWFWLREFYTTEAISVY